MSMLQLPPELASRAVHRAQARSLDALALTRETESALRASNAHDDVELTHKQRAWRALLATRRALLANDVAEARRQNFIAMREANAAELEDLKQRAEANRALGKIDPAIECNRHVNGYIESLYPFVDADARQGRPRLELVAGEDFGPEGDTAA